MNNFKSTLVVPGIRPEWFGNAIDSGADVVLFDLEDSVAENSKDAALLNVMNYLSSLAPYGKFDPLLGVRVNGINTEHMLHEISTLVECCFEMLDFIMIPKVNCYEDLYVAHVAIQQAAMANDIEDTPFLAGIIETAEGLANVEDIARRGAKIGLEALYFGGADYSASISAMSTDMGTNVNQWRYARERITNACRAYGISAIDGPYGDIKNIADLELSCLVAAKRGMSGKLAIHPTQVSVINRAFTPDDVELTRAHSILENLNIAYESGHGVTTLDGGLIGIASEKQAKAVLRKA